MASTTRVFRRILFFNSSDSQKPAVFRTRSSAGFLSVSPLVFLLRWPAAAGIRASVAAANGDELDRTQHSKFRTQLECDPMTVLTMTTRQWRLRDEFASQRLECARIVETLRPRHTCAIHGISRPTMSTAWRSMCPQPVGLPRHEKSSCCIFLCSQRPRRLYALMT